MPELQNITYCGLYCKLCSTKSRLPKTATALRDTMAKEGWPMWGEHAMPDFGTFWTVLNKFADFAETCPDCRGGCGNPACEIRKCAVERKVDLCPTCEQYPCEHVNALAKHYPNLIADGKRLGGNRSGSVDRGTGDSRRNRLLLL